MDYHKELTERYNEVKDFEWSSNKLAAPKSLASLAWSADRVYLLYGLRLYVRWLAYQPLFPERELGLREKDFEGLLKIIRRRMALLEKEDVLWAYWRTAQLIDPEEDNIASPDLIKDHIFFLYSKADVMEQEDYVDNLGYLNLFCTRRVNLGDLAYNRLCFQANLFMIERKYGASWRRGHTPLPVAVFSNLAINALNLKEWSDWQAIKMHGLSFQPGPVSVYDWVAAYIKAYARRMEKEQQRAVVAYVRARLEFDREEYAASARQLLKIKDMPLDFFGLSRRRITLMAYYELRYCHVGKVHPVARKIEPDLPAAIKKLKGNLRDLKDRKDRLLPHYENLMPFLEGYKELMHFRDKLSLHVVPGSKAHRKLLIDSRRDALEKLQDYQHESGSWLREKWNEM